MLTKVILPLFQVIRILHVFSSTEKSYLLFWCDLQYSFLGVIWSLDFPTSKCLKFFLESHQRSIKYMLYHMHNFFCFIYEWHLLDWSHIEDIFSKPIVLLQYFRNISYIRKCPTLRLKSASSTRSSSADALRFSEGGVSCM